MTTSVSPDCAAIAAADIITSATQVECELLGVHPRLLCVRHPFDRLRSRLGVEPWKHWFEQLRREGDKMLSVALPEKLMNTPYSVFDVRGLGSHLIHLALLHRLTQETKYQRRVEYLMDRLAAEEDWGDSLIFGHWAQGFAVALDWLWHDLAPEARAGYVETLYQRTRHVFDKWATYKAGEPFGYTWNISAVVLGGMTAAAACLYGERPDVGPLANMACEKMRAQSAALGPDGVSPEGIMYGGYYASYLTVNFLIAEELFGIDLYNTTPWLARHALALHAQSLPRDSWKADDAFFMQGDAHGNVFGIETVLRVIASAARDGTAQWFADELLRSGHLGIGAISFLLYDPDVRPVSPLGREPFALMEDHGIAVMRSNWSGDETASVFKCGPNVGHHAARRHNNPLGGGHMYPNNGELQVFAHGEWILTYPGYVYKDTKFHNTLLINGVGQYGEKSEWFEDLPYRQRRVYPFMERADHHAAWDCCVADLTAAYPVELGLKQLRRHVLYVRPDAWIIVDALESTAPTTPTLLFHTGFPVEKQDANTFTGSGTRAACRIHIHAPDAVTTSTENQPRVHTGGDIHGTMPLLRVSPAAPATRHLCVTSIEAYPKAGTPQANIDIAISPDQATVRVTTGTPAITVTLFPFGKQAPVQG